MPFKSPAAIRPADITDEQVYAQRRRFLRLGAAGALALVGGQAWAGLFGRQAEPPPGQPDFPDLPRGPFGTDEEPTGFTDATGYNNFYELGSDKSDPAANAHRLKTAPWSVTVTGEVERPGTYTLEDILKPHPLEERIYRLRCVEGWSMVIPWVGFPLGDLLKRFGPTSRARYVAFSAIHDPERLPGQRRRVLEWPYAEGLRLDEAMHPLTLLAVGLYGRTLPAQNGAPLRLVVPWKYGFKSIKSIVAMRLTEQMPPTAWNRLAPDEYGFYANVNPAVSHPRWSQARERRIGELFKRDTLPFNGYAEQVAHLYHGMDLKQFF